jgi:hypothetical protein
MCGSYGTTPSMTRRAAAWHRRVSEVGEIEWTRTWVTVELLVKTARVSLVDRRRKSKNEFLVDAARVSLGPRAGLSFCSACADRDRDSKHN